jgi:hypothetical protein
VETWRFSSTVAGEKQLAALSLIIRWTRDRGTGAFAFARARQRGGGLLRAALLLQDGGDDEKAAFDKKCGKFVSRTSFTTEDPGSKHKTHWVLFHYEKCDFLKQIDDNEQMIGSAIELTRGAEINKGGAKALPLSTPLSSSPVGKTTEKRSGQIRIFLLTGCKNARVVQYVKSSLTFRPPESDKNAKMPKDSPGDWHLDGADPYPGAIKTDTGDTLVSDVPAAYESEVADSADVKSLPKGATATYTWSLETFFYCDGNLLFWISWGGSVTFTMGDDGKLTPGTPAVDQEKEHGKDEVSQSPGNPKK